MTNSQMVDKIKARVEVVEEFGGSIESDPNIIENEPAIYIK